MYPWSHTPIFIDILKDLAITSPRLKQLMQNISLNGIKYLTYIILRKKKTKKMTILDPNGLKF
jgi:hypothetical protein